MKMDRSKKNPITKEFIKEKLRERRKKSKEVLKEKRARLILKNLPFKATEENIREYFEKFGEITSVDLLKKPDGKSVGCGFVQFKLVQKAAKARHHTDKKPFLGRDINVDFAKPKDKFIKERKQERREERIKLEDEVKEEPEEEPIDVDIIKDEEEESETEEKLEKEVVKEEESAESNSESDQDISDEEDMEYDEDEIKKEEQKPRFMSHDVAEGKTVFVKNVPFSVTNDDLKECMDQFGPILYALICMDKLTEHSKGTAFVKFKYKEDAEKALQAGTELTLQGNILDCHPALERNQVQDKITAKQQQKSQPKDSRNLYLVKEGVILAGTKAAEGVSASDMAKRLQLEQYKTQMLRNLNMYISRERLIIHNLPATWDDNKLRILFKKYAGEGAVIKEVRIMRDIRNVDATGVGTSKEHGFVSFTRHEDAITALRALNNNPNIFSANKRPIVAFSIENKAMIKAKLKRLEKSIQFNPNSKRFDATLKKKPKWEDRKKGVRRDNVEAENLPKFSGVPAKPGTVQKMRSRYKLTTQAKLHYENLKMEKNKKKNSKKTLAQKKQDFTKQPKQKINKKVKENDNFAKLVNDYKKKLMSVPEGKKTKWYG